MIAASTFMIPPRSGHYRLRQENEEKPMAETPAVRVERDGPVTTVILCRPDVRNAVDGKTASALADAFLAFERDPEAKVGVFWGDHGTFCAGADLKALTAGRGNRVDEPVTGSAWDPLAI